MQELSSVSGGQDGAQMSPSTVTVAADQSSIPQAAIQLYAQHQRGAQWFYWIAALSILNTLITLSGSSWSFIVGLGSTQVVDAFAGLLKEEAVLSGTVVTLIALAIDAGLIGLFALWGWLAKKGHTWAYIVGMVLFALDGLIFVFVGDWLSVGFHVFALWGLFRGLRALGQLKRLSKSSS